MKGWEELDRFLRTDPRDVGCEKALEVLHSYVELWLAGQPPDDRYAGVTAHLESCGPCGEDFNGLLAAARALRQQISDDPDDPGPEESARRR